MFDALLRGAHMRKYLEDDLEGHVQFLEDLLLHRWRVYTHSGTSNFDSEFSGSQISININKPFGRY